MALTLVSTTAAERLRRHVASLSEAEAQDALRLLVHRREQAMAVRRVRVVVEFENDPGHVVTALVQSNPPRDWNP